MAEELDPKRLKRRLAELRGLLERVEQGRLEADDWALMDSLVAESIDEGEAAEQESLIVEPQEEQASGAQDGAVGAEAPARERASKADPDDRDPTR